MSNSAMKPIPAILIAGREVRHLRVPKQTLPFGEKTVLGRTIETYLEAGVSEIILVLGYKAELIEASLGPLPNRVKILRNPLFDEGMGTFLRVGVRELPQGTKAFMLGLGDQPILTADLIRELVTAYFESGKKILVPVCQSSAGLPAIFDISLIDDIQSLPPDGELWDILKRHADDLADHPTEYTAVLRSIEDQEDYHAMLRLAGLPIPEPPPPPEPEPEPEQETDGTTVEGMEAEEQPIGEETGPKE